MNMPSICFYSMPYFMPSLFQKALCYYMVTNTVSARSLFSQDGIDIVLLTQKCSCVYMHTTRLSLFTEMCEMFLYYMPTTRLSLFT